jgi:hypothetical protein
MTIWRDDSRLLPATSPGPEPGDFELGSPASRAAARRLLEGRERATRRAIIFVPIPNPGWEAIHGDRDIPEIGPWQELAQGAAWDFWRIVYLPQGYPSLPENAEADVAHARLAPGKLTELDQCHAVGEDRGIVRCLKWREGKREP